MLQGTYLNISGRWVCPSVWLLWNSFCFMACTVFSSYIFGARLFESRLTLPQGLEKVNRSFKISFPLICVFNCSCMLCIAWDCSNSKMKNKWYTNVYRKRTENVLKSTLIEMMTCEHLILLFLWQMEKYNNFLFFQSAVHSKKNIYIYCNDSNTF